VVNRDISLRSVPQKVQRSTCVLGLPQTGQLIFVVGCI
jgi:hypothetical protein